MKEIIDLHLEILALPEEVRPENGVNFSREEDDSERVELLPEALQTEVDTLRRAINEALPEDFDYFAFAGDADEGPAFDLECAGMPSSGSEDDTFRPDRSLVEQLQEIDWETQRAKGAQFRQTMDGLLHLTGLLSNPLRSTKSLQREFREEAKDFIKEKRADASRIHVLYWEEEEALLEADFADGDALREVLPNFVAQQGEVITIVAWGKPLPVDRIDALMTQAQQTLRERVATRLEKEAAEAAEQENSPEVNELP